LSVVTRQRTIVVSCHTSEASALSVVTRQLSHEQNHRCQRRQRQSTIVVSCHASEHHRSQLSRVSCHTNRRTVPEELAALTGCLRSAGPALPLLELPTSLLGAFKRKVSQANIFTRLPANSSSCFLDTEAIFPDKRAHLQMRHSNIRAKM